ncbi:MAG: KTSC domain-containing protein [Chloroflexi bacterium]|nr:KTSC domain-containing protein [Chloroflexota bacterium]
MKRENIESSIIRSIGYDEEKGVLEVEFRSGSVYDYDKVPRQEYDEMMKAPSHGGYFNTHIRDAYPHTKEK